MTERCVSFMFKEGLAHHGMAMPRKKSIEQLKKVFRTALEPSLDAKRQIDRGTLAEINPELHHVLKDLADAKTWRDDPNSTAADLAKLITARDQQSALGASLARLEKTMKKHLERKD